MITPSSNIFDGCKKYTKNKVRLKKFTNET